MTQQESLNASYAPLIDQSMVLKTLGDNEESRQLLAQLNGPFLVAVSEQYGKSHPKVVVVGQENYYWTECDFLTAINTLGLDGLLNIYRGFDIGTYSTPFGLYFKAIREAIRGEVNEDNKRSVIWTNLYKLNHNGRGLGSLHSDLMLRLQGDIVCKEIEILSPDVVIFLTGPNYDHIVSRMWPNARFTQLTPMATKRQVAQVSATGLPLHSYRIYHPNYLTRKKLSMPHFFDSVLEAILRYYPAPNSRDSKSNG